MVEAELVKLVVGPLEGGNAHNEARPSLQCEGEELAEDLGAHVLEHGGDDALLEGGQVLGDLAVDLVVLRPQLQARRREQSEA